MSIYVIDEMMGRGKTSAMINYINQSGDDVRYLFIVPLLTEVERIRKGCASKDFVEPSQFGGKLNNIKQLLAEGRNIVSTHALFSRFDDETLQYIKEGNYTLVMDEITTVIRDIRITRHDYKLLTEHYIQSTESGQVVWIDDDYEGKLGDYKEQISGGHVQLYKGSGDDGGVLMTVMPREFFTSFKDVFLMTYMFRDQLMRCYFDLEELQYERLYINGSSQETFIISDHPEPRPDLDYSPLIRVLDNDRLNRIGAPKTSLTKTWYIRNADSRCMDELRRNTINFFRNYSKTPSSQNLWSTFCKDEEHDVDWPEILAGGGYKKGFLACNSKGTNQYRNKTALAYLLNIYPNTRQKTYLYSKGIAFNDDFYALSEMLQWIWRSAIRDGKPVQLYVPSLRMRTLLKDWLATKGQEVDIA